MNNGFYLAAARKSSGKTSLSIGLTTALKKRGFQVQAFKKGPDYIDPMWLSIASGKQAYNLDFYTQSHHEINSLYQRHSANADISLVEGNMGLFDGTRLTGGDCNASMAKMLGLPVVLVIDASGMSRNVAALVLGMQLFDPDLQFAGVILNKVGGGRHSQKLISAIEYYTDLSVIGALERSSDLAMQERHLGLVPVNESRQANRLIQALGIAVEKYVDIEKLLPAGMTEQQQIADNSNIIPIRSRLFPNLNPKPDFNFQPRQTFDHQHSVSKAQRKLRIGIAKDDAFGFYYPDDLHEFSQQDIELVPVSLLEDSRLPTGLDALFIGGGFPETHLPQLASNRSMMNSVREAIENWLPVYAECGGLMYLSRQISWQGKTQNMVNAIPGDVIVHDRPVGKGYIKLKSTMHHPWLTEHGSENATIYTAHEFHYSELTNLPEDSVFAYQVERGHGITGKNDGYTYKNLLANYGHLRHLKQSPWIKHFKQFVFRQKQQLHAPDSLSARL